MKMYQNREELSKDIKFIKETISDNQYKEQLINELFESWKNSGQDSPWKINDIERDAVKTLIKISEDGVSNEWCGEHIIFEEIESKHNYNLRKRDKL